MSRVTEWMALLTALLYSTKINWKTLFKASEPVKSCILSFFFFSFLLGIWMPWIKCVVLSYITYTNICKDWLQIFIDSTCTSLIKVMVSSDVFLHLQHPLTKHLVLIFNLLLDECCHRKKCIWKLFLLFNASTCTLYLYRRYSHGPYDLYCRDWSSVVVWLVVGVSHFSEVVRKHMAADS